ncbi:S8 family serine peptidase [Streptomyces sp. NK15101]|uniref:S8 family serine peptidase n=1 Tax=Streptomyces sp. NK15101 TaxID=2873261 RepID=UPI001CED7328|nr:S8 family serine peptidase [Streptomyces sp. NK15101]
MVGRGRVARPAYRLAAVSAATGALLAGGLTGAEAAEPEGRYIVVLDDSARGRADSVERAHGRDHGVRVGLRYRHALVGYSAVVPESQVAALRADPNVKAVAPDRPVHATQQVLPTGVDRIQGDASSALAGNGTGAVDTAVAILDTGIDERHRDLNVVGGFNCMDTSRPNAWRDNNGHGTHVAGTVAARDNGDDVVGVVPGARLYAVKVLGASGGGFTSTIVCGLDWLAQNAATLGIKVANMSLGGEGTDDGNCGFTNQDPEHQAICRVVNDAGVTVVAAAGNETDDLANHTPAAFDEVLAVTAMADFDGQSGGGAAASCRTGNQDDTAANFSNFAVTVADAAHTIAGPGVCIRSTRRSTGTVVYSGTSMASPHVAGTAALCLATGQCSDPSPAAVAAQLRADAAAQSASYGFAGDPNAPVTGRYYGHLVHAGGY